MEETVQEFVRAEKPWWVWIRAVQLTGDGTVYGLGSDGKMYNWHHSFAHAGKWVLLVTGK